MDNKKEYKIMDDEELRKMIGKASEIFIKLTEPKTIKEEEVKQKSISPKTAV